MALFTPNCATCGAPLGVTNVGGPQGLLNTSVLVAAPPTVNNQYCSDACLAVGRGHTGPPDRTRGAVNDGMPFVRHWATQRKVA